MNLDYYNEDILDAFLKQELSEEEATAIRLKMESDTEYAEVVELHKIAIQALQLKAVQAQMQAMTAGLEADGFFDNQAEDELDQTLGKAIKEQQVQAAVAEISNELEKSGFYNQQDQEAGEAPDSNEEGGKVRSLLNVRYIGIAASVLLVIGAFYFMMPATVSSESLYASHFSTPAETVSEDLDMLLAGQGFAAKKEELLEIKKGLTAYNAKDYNKAIAVFEAVLAKGGKAFDQNELRYLLALSQMAEGQPKAALKNLNSLNKLEGFGQQEAVLWYTALAYLKLNDKVKTKAYLEQLVDSKEFGPAAKDLLKVKALKNATTIIDAEDRSSVESEKKISFGLKDISKLSLTINPANGVIRLWNEGQPMPTNIQVEEISIDVFDGEAYSGSLLLKGNESLPIEEIMPDEVLVFNLVVLKDSETKETAGWERVEHQWVGDEKPVDTES